MAVILYPWLVRASIPSIKVYGALIIPLFVSVFVFLWGVIYLMNAAFEKLDKS